MKFFFAIFALFVFVFFSFAETRGVSDLFPGAEKTILAKATEEQGYSVSIKTAGKNPADSIAMLTLKPKDEIEIAGIIAHNKPSYIIESLLIIPVQRETTLLDVYNVLGMVRNLQGKEYFSATREKYTALFEEASRLESENRLRRINDPPPAKKMVLPETIFILLKDANFGNCYYQAEINTLSSGLVYSFSNFKNINYFLFPVIKKQNLIIRLYLEPVDEGILVYGITGIKAAESASGRVDIPSAIRKRLDVIYDWIAGNLRGTPGA